MERYDVVIVGAGLLGCFAARSLSRYDLRILVLERREDVCTGISKANTGIVYAGYDNKPDTLKAKLCVKANAGFADLCRELGVNFVRRGSLMIARGPRAQGILEGKFTQGLANGVPGLQLLDAGQVLEKEPNLCHTVTGGLYAPTTGVVNPWELGIAAFENARANGAEFHFREELLHMEARGDRFRLETDRARYDCRAVINCAGLSADGVRELLLSPRVRLFPSAADYLVLDDTAHGFIRHVIFHEPETEGKGLTLVPTADGNLLVGPTDHSWDGRPGMGTDIAELSELRQLCAEIVPGLDLSQTIRNFGSLRPHPYAVYEEEGTIRREPRSISTFSVLEEAGLFSLIGIKTPGLTCAHELGEYVTGKILDYLGSVKPNPHFDPIRRPIPQPRTMNDMERAALIRDNKDYGQILCRCREVSRGEVLEAIGRGAVTVDGVKRRTGTGLGRCQGGYCTQAIWELLANSLEVPQAAVTKDGEGTVMLYDDGQGEKN